MSNKFLGLDSINILKQYIDEQILSNEESIRLINIQAYKYVEGQNIPAAPTQGGVFDPSNAKIEYPTDWYSLKTVIEKIGTDEDHETIQQDLIEEALSKGSIWMSVGVSIGNEQVSDWSSPIKVSGQNGVSVKFSYSYDENATEKERTNTPSGVNANNRKEYVWTKYGEDEWQGPTLWAMYSEDSSDVLYRYCITATNEKPNAPISDIDSNWMNSISASVTSEKPYMWMSYKRIPAGKSSDESNWSEPILFGHYGKDGKDGKDGNVPDYSITFYAMSDTLENVPEFECTETENIDEVREKNISTWFDIPSHENETENTIWWYIIVNVNGNDNTVKNFSKIKRYSALDGEAQPGVFTKYLFYWSENQSLPENLNDSSWTDEPEYKTDEQDGSLWMKMTTCKVNITTGEIEVLNEWSNPVKLTGPRGPIAYDYRYESLFKIGTATEPQGEETQWKQLNEITTTEDYPYIWEKRFLAVYKMEYSNIQNEDGTFDIVQGEFLYEIEPENGKDNICRLSGLNGIQGKDGKNGNRLNTIDYTTTNKNLSISNFDEINYFISNSNEDVYYTLNGNKFSEFISGYTGKFVNIGTSDMIIETKDAYIVGSNTQTDTITVEPQESIELISYLNDNKCEFILIGKPIQ